MYELQVMLLGIVIMSIQFFVAVARIAIIVALAVFLLHLLGISVTIQRGV